MNNVQSYPLWLRLSGLTDRGLVGLFQLLSACRKGLLLGFLSRESLHLVDKYYYDSQEKHYCNEEYNKKGLWGWEKEVIDAYFGECRSLLVTSVGGGREVLALRKIGYEVDGFECHEQMVEFANQLLEKEGFIPNLQPMPRDQCQTSERVYDGLIVGWGSYMLIQGRDRRVEFLRSLHERGREMSPVLLSFFFRSDDSRQLKIVMKLGNMIRWLLRRDYLEYGDDLSPNYVHHFTKEEIASELGDAGFELQYYSTKGYGHAVATLANS